MENAYTIGARKLSRAQAEAIRRERGKVPYKILAHEYGVSKKTIWEIMSNRRYVDPTKKGKVCPRCGQEVGEVDRLKKRDEALSRLEAAGVDNWEGYGAVHEEEE